VKKEKRHKRKEKQDEKSKETRETGWRKGKIEVETWEGEKKSAKIRGKGGRKHCNDNPIYVFLF
jgi:hypothetical protein